MMHEQFFRAVELVFTAYMVPALLVPLAWVVGYVLRQSGPRDLPRRLTQMQIAYAAIACLWFASWLAVRLGLPIELGGKAVGWLSWAVYFALNLTLAMLLVAFVADYGGLPEGSQKDRLFVRFLSIILLQPVVTAFAFAVLYRIMRLVYHANVPTLLGVQEGI